MTRSDLVIDGLLHELNNTRAILEGLAQAFVAEARVAQEDAEDLRASLDMLATLSERASLLGTASIRPVRERVSMRTLVEKAALSCALPVTIEGEDAHFVVDVGALHHALAEMLRASSLAAELRASVSPTRIGVLGRFNVSAPREELARALATRAAEMHNTTLVEENDGWWINLAGDDTA